MADKENSDNESLDFTIGSRVFAVPDAELINLILAAEEAEAGPAGLADKKKKKGSKEGVAKKRTPEKKTSSPDGAKNKKQKLVKAGEDSRIISAVSGSRLSAAPSTTISGTASAAGSADGPSPRGQSPNGQAKPVNQYENPYCVPKKGVTGKAAATAAGSASPAKGAPSNIISGNSSYNTSVCGPNGAPPSVFSGAASGGAVGSVASAASGNVPIGSPVSSAASSYGSKDGGSVRSAASKESIASKGRQQGKVVKKAKPSAVNLKKEPSLGGSKDATKSGDGSSPSPK